ncbi:M23 family metallopeptidase [Microbacterium murale]|uniref:Murein DD-endopeptidase MepM/ murein hydrolase activator NlpD n=1 Tax=Microbacterium murale TaxID=1081040 RepID=A0ABU0PEE9_9MICO|nr:M23 family metallopeptidase [Microbacterium murale]MDQ0645711.1 murein DD-endopeptidase MepM/ murein hydrolase activator NlpD [Microbacterium murale]
MRVRSSIPARRPIILLLLLALFPGTAPAPPTPDPAWVWPVDGPREVTSPFRAPAHDYGPGHRGLDMSAPVGAVVHAPADGIVAFRGVVVDRPLLTIDHGDGIVTTLEPVDSTLTPGAPVTRGEEIGTVANGGHSPDDQLHLGVRYNDVYVNPMLMFGDVPRAILLPCCAASSAISSHDRSSVFTHEGGRVGRSL